MVAMTSGALSASPSTAAPTLNLFGAQLTLYDCAGLLDFIGRAIDADERRIILSGNVYAYNLLYEQPWLREFFNEADAIRLDGAGVGLAARMLGEKPPPRMTWADFAWDLAEFSATRNDRWFLLGARPGVAEQAAQKLQAKYPELRIVGVQHGYFDKESDSPENQAVLAAIRSARPNILILGFGMPLQEAWLQANREKIEANVTLTGGAVFDYLSGELNRAPEWITNHGMEWFGRMLIEPRRLWRRYLLGNPQFVWRVAKQRIGLPSVPSR